MQLPLRVRDELRQNAGIDAGPERCPRFSQQLLVAAAVTLG
jgi:hypothetical protein